MELLHQFIDIFSPAPFFHHIISCSAGENIKTVFDILGDAMSNVVLTICCVLLLSYLRQAKPNLKITPRFIGLLSLPAMAGIIQRLSTRMITLSKLPQFESFIGYLTGVYLRNFYNNSSGNDFNQKVIQINQYLQELLNPESDKMYIYSSFKEWFTSCGLSSLITVLTSALAFFCICFAAFRIMNIHKKKHAVPMLGFIVFCVIVRFILSKPYEFVVANIIDFLNIPHKALDILSYNLFIYGAIMLIAIIWYLSKSSLTVNKKSTVLRRVLYLLMFVIFYTIFNICANATNFSEEKVSAVLLLLCFILTFTFTVISLFYGIKKPYKLIQEDVEFQNKYDERKADSDAYDKSNKEINKFNHDLPKNLTIIEEIAANENAAETEKLVHTLLDNLIKARKGFVTGNDYLDTVLYKENEKAKANGSEIVFDGIFPEKGIETFDIITIFSNALDNAIEACSELAEHACIECSSMLRGDYVYFRISNPYKKIKTDKGNNLITTKSDFESHGYGLKNINDTINKKIYDGSLKITHENNIFTLEIRMKYQNSEA